MVISNSIEVYSSTCKKIDWMQAPAVNSARKSFVFLIFEIIFKILHNLIGEVFLRALISGTHASGESSSQGKTCSNPAGFAFDL